MAIFRSIASYVSSSAINALYLLYYSANSELASDWFAVNFALRSIVEFSLGDLMVENFLVIYLEGELTDDLSATFLLDNLVGDGSYNSASCFFLVSACRSSFIALLNIRLARLICLCLTISFHLKKC